MTVWIIQEEAFLVAIPCATIQSQCLLNMKQDTNRLTVVHHHYLILCPVMLESLQFLNITTVLKWGCSGENQGSMSGQIICTHQPPKWSPFASAFGLTGYSC